MNIYEFMGEHQLTTIILAIVFAQIAWGVLVILPNRIMRHWNIRKHGYPPAHLDADGDFRPIDNEYTK